MVLSEGSASQPPAAAFADAHTVSNRAAAALQCLFIGDALAMPVHWFYRASDISKSFPPAGITRMEAAPEVHPSSIMALHSTHRGGRGSQAAETGKRWFHSGMRHEDDAAPTPPAVVGDVILRGRRHLWGRPNGHYHHQMRAGENTLNAWCAEELLALLTDQGGYDIDAWLAAYVDLMCADPPRHPDTYAESYHRGFFANRQAGKPLRECAAVTHDTPSMGALVTVAPLAIALFGTLELATVQAICRTHVALTHPDTLLAKVVGAYVKLLHTLLYRRSDEAVIAALTTAAAAVPGTRLSRLLNQHREPAEVVGGTYSLACYITDSWPSVCYLAARYCQNAEAGLLRNANLGGENAHRGAVLGTLLGLIAGQAPASLFAQLARSETLATRIARWQTRFFEPVH